MKFAKVLLLSMSLWSISLIPSGDLAIQGANGSATATVYHAEVPAEAPVYKQLNEPGSIKYTESSDVRRSGSVADQIKAWFTENWEKFKLAVGVDGSAKERATSESAYSTDSLAEKVKQWYNQAAATIGGWFNNNKPSDRATPSAYATSDTTSDVLASDTATPSAYAVVAQDVSTASDTSTPDVLAV